MKRASDKFIAPSRIFCSSWDRRLPSRPPPSCRPHAQIGESIINCFYTEWNLSVNKCVEGRVLFYFSAEGHLTNNMHISL